MKFTVTTLWIRICDTLRRSHDSRGASLVEYALLMALIAIVCVTAVSFLGSATSESFGSAADSVTAAG